MLAMLSNEQQTFSSSSNDDAVSFLAALRDAPAEPWGEAKAEGQLAVDVLETAEEVVIVATMAGTRPEDIELHLHNDFLTIRGKRISPVDNPSECFTKECYWGRFSRTIVLPVDVKGEMASSEYKHGVLTIRLPKARKNSSIPITVVEE